MTTPPTDPNKLRAARDQLKKEREEIITAAIEAGTAIRVPVSITQHGGDIEEVKQRVTEELRRNGEKREIYFDESTIFTGVPRSAAYFSRAQIAKADEAPKERVRATEGEAIRAQGFPAQYRPPQVSDVPSTERCRLRTTVQLPNATAPQGEVAEGWFMVRGGVLHVEDMHGRLKPCSPGTMRNRLRAVSSETRAAGATISTSDCSIRPIVFTEKGCRCFLRRRPLSPACVLAAGTCPQRPWRRWGRPFRARTHKSRLFGNRR